MHRNLLTDFFFFFFHFLRRRHYIRTQNTYNMYKLKPNGIPILRISLPTLPVNERKMKNTVNVPHMQEYRDVILCELYG